MNLVLRGLQERGLLSRPEHAQRGRARFAGLTAAGKEIHSAASRKVRAIEDEMISPLTDAARRELLAALHACSAALDAPDPRDRAAERR